MASREFVPPEGIHRISLSAPKSDRSSRLGPNTRLWLFRLPQDVPLSALNDVNLPVHALSSTNTVSFTTTPSSSNRSSTINKYAITQATQDESSSSSFIADASEAMSMRCVHLADDGHAYVIAPQAFDRVYHIMPSLTTQNGTSSNDMDVDDSEVDVDVSTRLRRELIDAGFIARNRPYVPREHPEGLKLQSLPFGFDADERVLIESKKRGHSVMASSSSRPKTTSNKPEMQQKLDDVSASESIPKKKKKKSLPEAGSDREHEQDTPSVSQSSTTATKSHTKHVKDTPKATSTPKSSSTDTKKSKSGSTTASGDSTTTSDKKHKDKKKQA